MTEIEDWKCPVCNTSTIDGMAIDCNYCAKRRE